MSVESIEGGDTSAIDRLDISDPCSDSEKTKERQGRTNHSQHYYGSSIEQSHGVRPTDEVRVVHNDIAAGLGGLSILNLPSKKDFATTALLCFFLGMLGAHRFYVGKPISGTLMLLSTIFTLGIVGGIWEFIDLIMIILGSFEDGEGKLIKHK